MPDIEPIAPTFLDWGWDVHTLEYLDEVLGDFIDYLDEEGGYF